MTGEQRNNNLGKEAKQSLAPTAGRHAMERQQKAQTVWHGVALQDGSVACQSLAATEAVEAAVAAFKVHSSDLLQDVFNCLVLAETVYKVQEGNHLEVASTVSALRQDFPAPLISLQRLQWSLPHVPHRYLLAEDNDALYVSFIGTKQRRDIMTNANIMQENLWPDLPIAADSQEVPAAHTGFLNRARGVPIQELYQLAKKLNKRLVLTGHSLGGAIALLCTLDLLHSLVDEPNLKLTCVGFATPAVGNAALAEYVKNKGWQKYITNYLVPEDVVTRLLPPRPATTAQSADQSADQAAGPAHPALWASLADNFSSSSEAEKAAAVVEVMDSVVQQRREQLGRLWMHRMPTYRARFHQIFYAALSLPLPHLAPAVDGASEDNVLVLSRPIAPEVHIVKADTSASLLSPHHLKDLLQDGVNAVAEQPGFRWFWIWSVCRLVSALLKKTKSNDVAAEC
ncbi:hypothetical protein WJX79_009904 [Trebouxia sp. C0005]